MSFLSGLSAEMPPKSFSSQVRVRRRIGEGGFAFVYAVEQSDDGRPMALKRLLAADAEKRKQTVQECSVCLKIWLTLSSISSKVVIEL